MDDRMVEVYRQLRDHPQICSERDVADYREILAPQPPSRAHIRRLQNADKPFHDPAIDRKPPTAETLRARFALDFHKRGMAKLAALRRTVEPAPEAPRPKRRYIEVIEPVQKRELYPEPKPVKMVMTPEQELSYDKNALFRTYERGGDVDMAEVARLFNSIDCWRREVQAWLDR